MPSGWTFLLFGRSSLLNAAKTTPRLLHTGGSPVASGRTSSFYSFPVASALKPAAPAGLRKQFSLFVQVPFVRHSPFFVQCAHRLFCFPFRFWSSLSVQSTVLGLKRGLNTPFCYFDSCFFACPLEREACRLPVDAVVFLFCFLDKMASSVARQASKDAKRRGSMHNQLLWTASSSASTNSSVVLPLGHHVVTAAKTSTGALQQDLRIPAEANELTAFSCWKCLAYPEEAADTLVTVRSQTRVCPRQPRRARHAPSSKDEGSGRG